MEITLVRVLQRNRTNNRRYIFTESTKESVGVRAKGERCRQREISYEALAHMIMEAERFQCLRLLAGGPGELRVWLQSTI